jgi:hypothetical protein
LPPIQNGGELDSLNAAIDSKSEEKPVEVSLYRTTGHVELLGDFRVITALQQQFGDLLLPWA